MSTRLPTDGGILGYWGFDEANPGDVAVDESGNGNPLTVYSAPSVVPARLGNGRQFDGVNTYAQPTDSSIFQVGVNTTIAWVILDSVNQSGDFLRPIATLEGPGVGVNDDTAFGLYVSNTGAIVYVYTDGSRNRCVYTSPAAVVRVNRYYSIVLRRVRAPAPPDGNNGLFHFLYINNVEVPWASLTVGGAPQGDPNAEAPAASAAGANVVLKLGAGSKTTSKWHGVLDEFSLHSTARAKKPYLDAAYFRLTLATTFQRLSMQGTVKILAAADMGGGTRWWCYQRDQSVYVIRENSLGLFSAEVQLTQGRDLAVGAPAPGGVERPRLAYDATTDTLVVAFIAAGRVFKVTATSTDVPSTLIMPFSADVSNTIKATDAVDIFRGSAGEQSKPVSVTEAVLNDNLPGAVTFVFLPSFGVAVTGSNAGGYAVFQTAGGETSLVGNATGAKQTTMPAAAGNYWFVPVATRIPGATYQAFPIASGRVLPRPGSNIIYDAVDLWAANVRPMRAWDPNAVVLNHNGSGFSENGNFSGGEGIQMPAWRMTTLYPLKSLTLDTILGSAGEGLYAGKHVITTLYPLKQLIMDTMLGSAGESSWLTMLVGTRRVQQ